MVIGELQGDLLLPKAGERGTDQSEAGFIIVVELTLSVLCILHIAYTLHQYCNINFDPCICDCVDQRQSKIDRAAAWKLTALHSRLFPILASHNFSFINRLNYYHHNLAITN